MSQQISGAERRRAKLTQEQLGERAGVMRRRISEIETGKASRIDLEMLGRLAVALGIEPGDLIEGSPRRHR